MTAAPASESHGGYRPFSYVTAPNAPLYRRVMRALIAEKERFTVHVHPDQVHATLQGDGQGQVAEDSVTEALERLANPAWGNLLAMARWFAVLPDDGSRHRAVPLELGKAVVRALMSQFGYLDRQGATRVVVPA